MNEDLNTNFKEKMASEVGIYELSDYKNIENNYKPVGEEPETMKDIVGFWTDKQILENPLSYLEYLERGLKRSQNSDEISKIISEIKRVEEKYLPSEYSAGRSR